MEVHFEIGYIDNGIYEVHMPLENGGSANVASGTLDECCDFIKALNDPDSYMEDKLMDYDIARKIEDLIRHALNDAYQQGVYQHGLDEDATDITNDILRLIKKEN